MQKFGCDRIVARVQSMNIAKAMFTEVTNQTEFIKALGDLKRIIVVNIQKFGELQNALASSQTQLGSMRVAFLIDEIHRSNTGENNREMLDLFEKLHDTINDTRSQGAPVKKKNLIVGFTATPTEKVLARFGEFKSASIIPTWVPFDAYTMREAIDDGYILDPTQHIIAVHNEPFMRWFADYKRFNHEASFMLQMEDGIRNWIRAQFERTAESEGNAPVNEECLQVVNEAKELRRNYGEYALAIEALEDVFDIDRKYRAPIFLSFWLKFCNIYRDVVRQIVTVGPGAIHPDIDIGDDVPGITIVEESVPEDENDEETSVAKSQNGDFLRFRRNVWDIILSWNEIEQLSKDEKEKWLAEVGKLFEWLRTKESLMVMINDDHFLPQDKLAEYRRLLVGYKFSLSRRADLVKAALFKNMLDDNAEQFFDVFAEGVLEADEQGRRFDFEEDASSDTKVEILSEIGEELKYRSLLPVYSLEAACGPLADGVEVEADGWIKAEGCGKLDETMFVVKTKGLSMEGLIPEGAYVILRKLGGGDMEGKTLLIQRHDVTDPESGGAYTIKRFTRRNDRVVLEGRRSEFDIELADPGDLASVYRPIAEFKTVLC